MLLLLLTLLLLLPLFLMRTESVLGLEGAGGSYDAAGVVTSVCAMDRMRLAFIDG